MRKIQKHNKLYGDISSIMEYIIGNTPGVKTSEKTDRIKDKDGIEKEIIYTVVDKKEAIHIFTITPEVNNFRLTYISLGEYPEYIEDDLDFI